MVLSTSYEGNTTLAMLRSACLGFAVVGAGNVRLSPASGQGAALWAKLDTEPPRECRRPSRSPFRKQVRARSDFSTLTRHRWRRHIQSERSRHRHRHRLPARRRAAVCNRAFSGVVEELAGIAPVPINIEQEDSDLRKPRQPVARFAGRMPGRLKMGWR